MKKRILSMFLAIVMVAGLLPATALAADGPPRCVCSTRCAENSTNSECQRCNYNPSFCTGGAIVVDASTPVVYAGGAKLEPNTYYLTVDGVPTTVGAGENSYNLHLVESTDGEFTLELNGADIGGALFINESNDGMLIQAGILVVGSLTLELSGENTITSGDGGEAAAGVYVIPSEDTEDDLTIQGDGLLNITAGSAQFSAGIFAISLDFVGGTVKAYGGEASLESCGISSYEVKVTGGTVTATGGAGEYSYGIYSYVVEVSGGAVFAYGGEASSDSDEAESYGIHSIDVTVTGGTLTAEGGEASSDDSGYAESYGIKSDTVKVSGGELTAKGGKATDASTGVDADELTVSGGNLIAEGGESTYSCGIEAAPFTLENGTVKATGGEASSESDEAESYGTCFVGDVQITGGTVSEGGKSYGIYIEGDNDEDITSTLDLAHTVEGTITAEGKTAAIGVGDAGSVTVSGVYTMKTGDSENTAKIYTPTNNFEGIGKWFQAIATEAYPVWVGGTRITAKNREDVLGDGKVSYNPDSKTLTLNGATIDGADIAIEEDSISAGILAMDDLNLVLNGLNAVIGIDNSNSAYSYAVLVGLPSQDSDTPKTLTISGREGAVLVAKGGESTVSVGIGADILTIESGTITVQGNSESEESFGISVNNSLTVNGGKVMAGGLAAIDAEDASITISGGDVSAEGKTGAGIAAENMTINGGVVKASSISGETGLDLELNLVITGGEVIATGGNYGISNATILSSGGTVTAAGTSAAFDGMPPQALTLLGNTTIKAGQSLWQIKDVDTVADLFNDSGECVYKAVEITNDGDVYPIWVEGEPITKYNADDVLDDGGKVSYNAETNTLTLNGAKLIGAENDKSSAGGAAIHSEAVLNLVLEGKNTVTGAAWQDKGSVAIFTVGDLHISGDGSLDVQCTEVEGGSQSQSMGIFSMAALTIESGTVTATGGDGADDNFGIYAEEITITGDNVTVKGGKANESYGLVTITLTIHGGELTATSAEPDDITQLSAAVLYADDFSLGSYKPVVKVGPSEGEAKDWDGIPPP